MHWYVQPRSVSDLEAIKGGSVRNFAIFSSTPALLDFADFHIGCWGGVALDTLHFDGRRHLETEAIEGEA